MSIERIRIRQADSLDLQQIYECERACFDDPWSFEMLYEEICVTPGTVYLVATDGWRVVGYCGMRIVLDEAHILNMCVRPEYRRCGLGKLLLESLMDAAHEHGTAAMTLEVRVSNKAALKLYTECGFQIEGLRKKYYQNKEDAYIMWTHKADVSYG